MVKGRIRFGFSHRGTYIWRVSGIVQGTGKEECTVSAESHGMVQAEETHFVYQDGTKYLPFGTTVYALMHQPEKLIRQTLDTLSRAPFNKIRLCVFPKHCGYNNNDPYGHLLSNHQCMKYYDFSRPAMTHCCVQSVAFQKTEQWHKRFRKPVIFDECCYEGDIEFD